MFELKERIDARRESEDASYGIRREAWWVFKDTRETIDTFIFNDQLCEKNDLLGDEMPVPEDWKKPGVVPRLRKETKS